MRMAFYADKMILILIAWLWQIVHWISEMAILPPVAFFSSPFGNFNHKIYKRTLRFPFITLNSIFSWLHARKCEMERMKQKIKKKRSNGFCTGHGRPTLCHEWNVCDEIRFRYARVTRGDIRRRRKNMKNMKLVETSGRKLYNPRAHWKVVCSVLYAVCGDYFTRINFIRFACNSDSDSPNPCCCTLMNNHILSHAAVHQWLPLHGDLHHVLSFAMQHLYTATDNLRGGCARLKQNRRPNKRRKKTLARSWLNFI